MPSQSNSSIYTLDTVQYRDDDHSDNSPLLSPATPNYGATFPRSPAPTSSARVIFNATIKMASLFIISSLVLGTILWLALPTLEE